MYHDLTLTATLNLTLDHDLTQNHHDLPLNLTLNHHDLPLNLALDRDLTSNLTLNPKAIY